MLRKATRLILNQTTVRVLSGAAISHARGGGVGFPSDPQFGSCASCIPAGCTPPSDHCGGGGGGGGIPSIEVCTIATQ